MGWGKAFGKQVLEPLDPRTLEPYITDRDVGVFRLWTIFPQNVG